MTFFFVEIRAYKAVYSFLYLFFISSLSIRTRKSHNIKISIFFFGVTQIKYFKFLFTRSLNNLILTIGLMSQQYFVSWRRIVEMKYLR